MPVYLQKESDEYRGAMDCVGFAPNQEISFGEREGNGCPDRVPVLKEGFLVGHLEEWYGNNGRGKLAASQFHPAQGVQVYWVDED